MSLEGPKHCPLALGLCRASGKGVASCCPKWLCLLVLKHGSYVFKGVRHVNFCDHVFIYSGLLLDGCLSHIIMGCGASRSHSKNSFYATNLEKLMSPQKLGNIMTF